MSGPLNGGTNHDAESGQPLVATQDSNAAPNGSILRGPVATSMSAAGQALAGLQKAVRAVRGPAQHAGFELVRSAEGERKHGDPDDGRDATGTVRHPPSDMGWLKARWCLLLSSASCNPEPPACIVLQIVGTRACAHSVGHRMPCSMLNGHMFMCLSASERIHRVWLAIRAPSHGTVQTVTCVAVQAGGSPRSRRACCRVCSSPTATASSPWAPARS